MTADTAKILDEIRGCAFAVIVSQFFIGFMIFMAVAAYLDEIRKLIRKDD